MAYNVTALAKYVGIVFRQAGLMILVKKRNCLGIQMQPAGLGA